jgi:protein SCO1/2
MQFGWRVSIVCAVCVLANIGPTAAQMAGSPTVGYKQEPGITSAALPAPLREIGFDQNIGEHVPLDTEFRDEAGRAIRLRDYFGKRPVVMVFAYYDCPMLCTMVINSLASALDVLSLVPGKDFEIVTVSFDRRDTPSTASAKKVAYISRYKQPGASGAWHFLVGDQASIDHLTKAAGFRYVWDTETKQFAHPTGVIVLTPDGRLARYLFGIEYGPRDLRYAIVEASNGHVGSAVDALLLYCFHYDPMTGRYAVAIMRVIWLAAAATLLGLVMFVVVMVRREKHQTNHRRFQSLRPRQARLQVVERRSRD